MSPCREPHLRRRGRHCAEHAVPLHGQARGRPVVKPAACLRWEGDGQQACVSAVREASEPRRRPARNSGSRAPKQTHRRWPPLHALAAARLAAVAAAARPLGRSAAAAAPFGSCGGALNGYALGWGCCCCCKHTARRRRPPRRVVSCALAPAHRNAAVRHAGENQHIACVGFGHTS